MIFDNLVVVKVVGIFKWSEEDLAGCSLVGLRPGQGASSEVELLHFRVRRERAGARAPAISKILGLKSLLVV